METVALTVNVPLGDLSSDTIREAVIAAAVDRVLGVTYYTTEDEDGNVFSKKDDRVYNELRREVQKIVTDTIRSTVAARVPAVVDEVIHAPFVPTNAYGEHKGAPITIRELIADTAKAWLLEKVDSNGATNGYSDKSFPRLQWMIRRDVDDAFKATVKAETDRIGADIKAQMSGRINAEIKAVVDRIVGVKS